MYHNLYCVQEEQQVISSTEQINGARKNFPNAEITSFTPSFDENRTSIINITDNGESVSLFINSYNGEIVGCINENERFMAAIKGLHNGELWGGTIGNWLVELAAC